MNRWQKYWLVFVLVGSVLHFVRDLLQDFGISLWLTEFLVKATKPSAWVFHPSNTYFLEAISASLALYSLKKSRFGITGWLTILVAASTFLGFLVYWFWM